MGPWRRALASTRSRKRAAALLVTVPFFAVFVAGLLLGAAAQSLAISPLALPVLAVAAALASWLVGRRVLRGATTIQTTQRAFWIPDKVAPLTVEADALEPVRVNVIHPAIDLKHFFGGFITVFSLIRKLDERGHRVRLITLEETNLPADWRDRLAAYGGIGDAAHRLEVLDAADRSVPVRANPGDSLLATHWTAAHVAAAASAKLGGRPFCYLIQEYEPFIFPQGSAALLAEASYGLPHRALFSTELLRDYFAARAIGVFAGDPAEGHSRSLAFRNAITPVGPVGSADLDRPGRRLLFYARPEAHAERNLFEIGAMALDDALAGGAFAGWEICAIGNVDLGDGRLHLPRSGVEMKLIPRTGEARYGELLRGFDVGLALMGTPHPSLVPIEMASAGMVTVTNTFENKDEAALRAISANLLAAPPTVSGVAAGLAEAETRSTDLPARVAGANVDWPDGWDQALGPETMAGIEALLRP